MPWMLALYEETPAIEDGMLVLPDKPGLGMEIDEDAAERDCGEYAEELGGELYYESDGSVADW